MLPFNAQPRYISAKCSIICYFATKLHHYKVKQVSVVKIKLTLSKSNIYFKIRVTLQKFTSEFIPLQQVKFGIDTFVHWAIVEVLFQYLPVKFDCAFTICRAKCLILPTHVWKRPVKVGQQWTTGLLKGLLTATLLHPSVEMDIWISKLV